MSGFLAISLTLVCFIGATYSEEIIKNQDPNQSGKFQCDAEGRFPHPFMCGSYVDCLWNDKTATYKTKFGTCHGAAYNATAKACMTFEQLFECKTKDRVARSIAADGRYSDVCSRTRNGFVCADCKTMVNCVEGVAYAETCATGNTCSDSELFGGAVCYPTTVQSSCSCDVINSFFPDFYNFQKYFFCNEVNGEPELYHCPMDMTFDVISQQCTNQALQNLPSCLNTGVFPDYANCNNYYTCIASRDGWVQKSFSCDTNLMFNVDTGVCEDPCTWEAGSFDCISEGRFADPKNCQHYYLCIATGEGFNQEHRQCPAGYQWSADALAGTGHCIKDSENACNAVEVSQCVVPEAQCPATGDSLPPIPRNSEVGNPLAYISPTPTRSRNPSNRRGTRRA